MSFEELDIWSLIQNGYFEQACKQADFQYSQTKDLFVLRNKVYALMQLKRYEEAVLLSSQLIKERNGETSIDFLFCGIANWFLNQRNVAISLWKDARKCLYKDEGGGIDTEVILYFSSIQTNDLKIKDEVIGILTKLLKSKKRNYWPIPLAQYLLGRITSEDLLSSVSMIPVIKERQLCQAYFAISTVELEKKNSTAYLENLTKIIDLGSNAYLEQLYYLAVGEISLGNI